MENKNWLLLVLDAAEGHPLSPAQLQKSLFLLSRALPAREQESFYNFIPYHYGPFNSAVYTDATSMQLDGLVEIARPLGRRWVEYEATPEGRAQAVEIAKTIPPELHDHLRKIVGWARSVSFQQLVRAIYEKYPEYRANSVFQG